jgi:hypothetical protein
MMIRENTPTLLQEKKHARICDQSKNTYRQIERVLKLHGGGFRNVLPAIIRTSGEGVLRIHKFILSKKVKLAIPPGGMTHTARTIYFSLAPSHGPHTLRLGGPKDRYISNYLRYHDRLIHMNRGAGLQDG